MVGTVSQKQRTENSAPFGLSLFPRNQSSHLATSCGRRNIAWAKNKESTTVVKHIISSGQQLEVTGQKFLSGITKASLNLMARSFASSPRNVFSIAPMCDSATVSSISSRSSSTRAQTKRVWFSAQAHVQNTISLEEYSDEEYVKAWYSKAEYEQITRSCCKLIKKIDRGDRLSAKQCLRGLETHTHLQALAKAKTRSSAIEAALAEQYRQTREGICDFDTIAHVYHDASANSQLWANVVGLQDQREAENAMDEMEELDSDALLGLKRPEAHDPYPKLPEKLLAVAKAA